MICCRASVITPDVANGNSLPAFGGAHRGHLFRKAELSRRACPWLASAIQVIRATQARLGVGVANWGFRLRCRCAILTAFRGLVGGATSGWIPTIDADTSIPTIQPHKWISGLHRRGIPVLHRAASPCWTVCPQSGRRPVRGAGGGVPEGEAAGRVQDRSSLGCGRRHPVPFSVSSFPLPRARVVKPGKMGSPRPTIADKERESYTAIVPYALADHG